MRGRYLSPSQRRAAAQRALGDLGADRRNHVLLRIRCSASHHVAVVFRTELGPVFVSVVGFRAHGSRDFADVAHSPHGRGTEYVDLLDGDRHADDELPAHCECGARLLSRRALRRAIDSAERLVLVQ
ncbi:MAG TPA: hypothetical protein VFG87_30120 [Amycolatopsis sp.]|nr:hypothetical protein [Amycolatopsis sp.]